MSFPHIVGEDPAFLRCLKMAEIVAPTDATVLIEGESGAGKEVFVQAIRSLSGKRSRTFVSMNCSAIPETLIESELFGYTAGSFTGASRGGKAGKFELADGGTIFLDEIGEMPLFMQSKLLRVLQSGEIQKIGSDKVQKVDVRVIAATNRDLKQMVADGNFREDLYFRSIPLKSSYRPCGNGPGIFCFWLIIFSISFQKKYHKRLSFSPGTAAVLQKSPWSGTSASWKAVWNMPSSFPEGMSSCRKICLTNCYRDRMGTDIRQNYRKKNRKHRRPGAGCLVVAEGYSAD